MTSDNEQRLASAVENLWFKGAARVAMLLLTVVGGPMFVIVMMRTYDTIDRLDRAELKLEALVDRNLVSLDNDRTNNARTVDNVNDRITILSNRITDVTKDFARTSDVKAGFDLRDQHLNTIDTRLGALEHRDKQQ